jgi:hypothetical protein
MQQLEAYHPLLALLLYVFAFLMGAVWLAFPFVVMSRLADIREHLKAIRGDADHRSPDEPTNPPQ